eukprot:14224-Heterococcus_DN1.PRE.7
MSYCESAIVATDIALDGSSSQAYTRYASIVTSVHYCTRYTLMMDVIMHDGVHIDICRAKTSNDSRDTAAAVVCYSCRAITDLLAVNRQFTSKTSVNAHRCQRSLRRQAVAAEIEAAAASKRTIAHVSAVTTTSVDVVYL